MFDRLVLCVVTTRARLISAIARKRVFLPSVIRDDDRSLVFFRQDDIFGKPKATCQFMIIAPPAYESPTAAVLSDLFAKLVKETLNELAYDASIAVLQYDFYNSVGVQL